MRSRFFFGVVAVLLLGGTVYGQTGEILSLVPKDALGFGIIHRLDQTETKFISLAQKAGAPMPVFGPLTQMKQFLGLNRGLNEKGTAAVVLLPGQAAFGPIAPPEVVGVLPVRDYKSFLKAMNAKPGPGNIAEATLFTGQKLLIAQRRSFRNALALVALVEHRKALRKVLQTRTQPTEETQSLQKWLIKVDAAAVAMKPGVNYVIQPMLDQFRNMKGIFDPADPEQRMTMWILDVYMNALVSFGNNMNYFAVGTQLNDAGDVRVSLRGGFVKDGDFAKSIKQQPAVKGKPLAGLPGGPFAFAAGFVTPKAMQQGIVGMFQFILDQQTNKFSKVERKKLIEFVRKVYDVDSVSISFTKPSKAFPYLMQNLIVAMKAPDARQYLEFYEKNALNWSVKFAKIQPQQTTRILSVKRVEDAQVPALEVTQKLTSTDPNEKRFWKGAIAKGDTITSTIAAIDDTTVIITMTPAKNLTKIVKAFKSNQILANRPEVKNLIAKLPANSQFLMLLKAQPLAELIVSVGEALDPNFPQKMPQFPDSPPAGFGLRLAPRGLEAELVVPIRLIENATGFFRKVLAQQAV